MITAVVLTGLLTIIFLGFWRATNAVADWITYAHERMTEPRTTGAEPRSERER